MTRYEYDKLTEDSESYTGPDLTPKFSPTTALAILLYNMSYVTYTRNVDVTPQPHGRCPRQPLECLPLRQIGEVEPKPCFSFWVFHVPNVSIYKRSHEMVPCLSSPTPPAFSLDSAQLMRVTTAALRFRPRLSAHARVGSSFSRGGG